MPITEVGGAYAYLNVELIKLLEITTRIIIDLDSTKEVGSKWKACDLLQDIKASNKFPKQWYGVYIIAPAALI